MPFAPTRNNRVAFRKRTLTSPIPTVKDGVVRKPTPKARAIARPLPTSSRLDASTPGGSYEKKLVSAPTVKRGAVRPPRPPRPQARISAKTIKVQKQPFIGVKASPLRAAKKNQKKSR